MEGIINNNKVIVLQGYLLLNKNLHDNIHAKNAKTNIAKCAESNLCALCGSLCPLRETQLIFIEVLNSYKIN